MKGLYAVLVILSVYRGAISQAVTKYRNPWVELVRQIACRSVTCNFQETCDLQVVCTPFGDCGQRATCLQIPFPRNTVCPDAFTNAGPPYTVECFDDAGCQEPMVCCHSYAKSYCHMPPFSVSNGAENTPSINAIMVNPNSETPGNPGTTRTPGNSANGNRIQNEPAGTERTNRGSRSVVVARSDFFDPQGFRREQRVNWQNALERRRLQELNALGTAVRLDALDTRRRTENELLNFPSNRDDVTRTSIDRDLNGGRLRVEIARTPGVEPPVIDVNGVRISADDRNVNLRPIDDRNNIRNDENRDRQREEQSRRERLGPSDDVLRNAGPRPSERRNDDRRQNEIRPSPPTPTEPNGPRDTSIDIRQSGRDRDQLPRDERRREPNTRVNIDEAVVRVNLHAPAEGARPFIRKTDLFRGHGFYGDRRRLLGEVQFEGIPGINSRFRT